MCAPQQCVAVVSAYVCIVDALSVIGRCGRVSHTYSSACVARCGRAQTQAADARPQKNAPLQRKLPPTQQRASQQRTLAARVTKPAGAGVPSLWPQSRAPSYSIRARAMGWRGRLRGKREMAKKEERVQRQQEDDWACPHFCRCTDRPLGPQWLTIWARTSPRGALRPMHACRAGRCCCARPRVARCSCIVFFALSRCVVLPALSSSSRFNALCTPI